MGREVKRSEDDFSDSIIEEMERNQIGNQRLGEDNVIGKDPNNSKAEIKPEHISEIANKLYTEVDDSRLSPDEAGKVFTDIMRYKFSRENKSLYRSDVHDIIEYCVWRDNTGQISDESAFREDGIVNTGVENNEDRNLNELYNGLEDVKKRIYFEEEPVGVRGSCDGSILGYKEGERVKLADNLIHSTGEVEDMVEVLIAETRPRLHYKAPFDYDTNTVSSLKRKNLWEIEEDPLDFGAIGTIFSELLRTLKDEGSIRQREIDVMVKDYRKRE